MGLLSPPLLLGGAALASFFGWCAFFPSPFAWRSFSSSNGREWLKFLIVIIVIFMIMIKIITFDYKLEFLPIIIKLFFHKPTRKRKDPPFVSLPLTVPKSFDLDRFPNIFYVFFFPNSDSERKKIQNKKGKEKREKEK